LGEGLRRPGLLLWSALLGLPLPARAIAADGESTARDACLAAYESSQLRRRDQALLEARKQLRTCASDQCPAAARSDCVKWLGEVDAEIPSVIFEATEKAVAVFDVSVKIDGVTTADRLEGHPVELDPGLHTFTFERKGEAPAEAKLIVRPAEKARVVSVELSPAPPAPPAAAPSPETRKVELAWVRPIPASVYVAGAVALVGLADFALAGALGHAKQQEIEGKNCSPFCSSADVADAKTRYAVADIGLAVGVAALVTGGVLVLTRPSRPVSAAHTVPFTPLTIECAQDGARMRWDGRF
jgi:hypothetical protein